MNKEALFQECDFKAVRSSDPGGQHVNKTSTKVMLHWSLKDSNGGVDGDQPDSGELSLFHSTSGCLLSSA